MAQMPKHKMVVTLNVAYNVFSLQSNYFSVNEFTHIFFLDNTQKQFIQNQIIDFFFCTRSLETMGCVVRL